MGGITNSLGWDSCTFKGKRLKVKGNVSSPCPIITYFIYVILLNPFELCVFG